VRPVILRKVLIVVSLFALGLAIMPAGHTQESFDCGDVIKDSIRLRNNLTNCAEDGLVIGASDITIDLGNQTIDGDGDGSGILNEKGFTGVEIRRPHRVAEGHEEHDREPRAAEQRRRDRPRRTGPERRG
jgi:hypothetical protein